MKNSIKKLLLAAAIAVAPGAASAVAITSNGVSGSSTCTVPLGPSAYQIDGLAGATFNATFDDGDAAVVFCFDINNTSATTQVVTLAVATVNQSNDLWGFTDGVLLSSLTPGVTASIAQGVFWSDSFTFNIAAGSSVLFDWSWGEAYASGFAKPNIDFAVFASPVPVPAAVWLFGSGLLGLVGIARRKKV